MAQEQYTRCPACRTIFRVTAQQLALRQGQVRCGHCRTVFDGVAQLISLAPMPREAEPPENDALGPATVTLRDARALEPAVTGPRVAPPPPPPDVDFEHRFAWDRPRRLSRAAIAGYVAAIVVLVLLLVLQAFHHFRDGIAARWPATGPMLAAMCRALDCEIRPLRDINFLSIEASSLESDPAHRGLLILAATLRNRARYAVEYPDIELTLTDQQDRVVVRRAIAPSEYLTASDDPRTGIRPNGEVAIKLFIDASASTQAGYRVYLFYR